jgi:hypothetical protein
LRCSPPLVNVSLTNKHGVSLLAHKDVQHNNRNHSCRSLLLLLLLLLLLPLTISTTSPALSQPTYFHLQ